MTASTGCCFRPAMPMPLPASWPMCKHDPIGTERSVGPRRIATARRFDPRSNLDELVRYLRLRTEEPGRMRMPWTVASAGQRRAALTFADQSVSSVSNFITGVIIARLFGPAEFGLYTLTVMVWLAVVGLHRALITEPVIIRSGAAHEPEAMVADGFGAELVLGGVLSIVVAAGGLAAAAAGMRIGVLILALSPWLVSLLVQDYWRAMSFRQYRPEVALANDLLFVTVQALMIVAFLALGWRSAVSVITAWGIGATAGALLGLRRFRVTVSPLRGWRLLRTLWPMSRWMTADFVTNFASDQTYLFVLAILLSKSDYGGFRAAYSFLGPVFVIALAAGNIGLPEAARRSDSADRTAAWRFARQLTSWTILPVALYAAAVAAAGTRMLTLLYGEQFARFGGLAVLVALAYVVTAMVFGQGVVLKAVGQVRRLWKVRVLVAGTSLISVTVLVRWLGISGAGWAAVTNAALYSAGIYIVYRGTMQRGRSGPPDDGASRGETRRVEGEAPVF